MKHVLLPAADGSDGGYRYYKINLHCHSVISDGHKTVEQIKADYKAHGYSAVAFTDHEIFLRHNDLTDEDFIALNGFEISVNEVTDDKRARRTCHICLVADDPDRETDVCYHRTKYVWGNAKAYRDIALHNDDEPDYERVYTPECVNDIMRRGKEAGFYVTYNHPAWSLESYPQYTAYTEANAMEIVNYGCLADGFDDDNGHAYEDMLRTGQKLFCVATDDNHNAKPDSDVASDSYGGCTMIAAKELSYASVMEALRAGRFYSRGGSHVCEPPEIFSLTYEDEVPDANGELQSYVTVRTSPARTIWYMPCARGCRSVFAPACENVTEARFKVTAGEKWFRIVVIDDNGYKAYTNAYFPEDIK